MIDKNNKAFAQGLPSVFIISTPLQVLCAVNAIRELKIEDYLLLFQYHEGEVRNNQVISMIDHFDLSYLKFVIPSNVSKIGLLFKSLFSSRYQRFKRIFIGDYRNFISKCIANYFIKLGSYLLYIDDGNASLSILRRNINKGFKRNCINFFFRLLYLLKFVNSDKYFYTLFHDIESNYILYPNDFRYVLNSYNIECQSNSIYFIGTNSSVYCNAYLEDNDVLYYEYLSNLLSKIKYDNPGADIIYIPHGRDVSDKIPMLCKNLGISFLHLNESVESFLVNNKTYPKYVYGFGSSALFNIKKLFCDTRVENYCLVSSSSLYYREIVEIGLYYQKHGIIFNLIDINKIC